MKSISVWFIFIFCVAIGSIAYADDMAAFNMNAFGGPGGGGHGPGGGGGFGHGPGGGGGFGPHGPGPGDGHGPGGGGFGPHGPGPGGPGPGGFGPHGGGPGYGPNHGPGDWHHGGPAPGWGHRPGWNPGWQWNRGWYPGWYRQGIYFPDFVFTDDVPDYWFQCTAFNVDPYGQYETYSDYAQTEDEAAYNALEQCGGDNYEAVGCYIPDGYCQQYAY